jgi:ubiquinone/menaquinone biosynthesis C-methylase UbiE
VDQEAADRFAGGYGRAARVYADVLDPTLGGVARRIVELAPVAVGARVLDVATGTGAVAREAARREATVVGIDIAEPMLTIARERSSSAITYVVADAASLPFGEESSTLSRAASGSRTCPRLRPCSARFDGF